MLSFISFVCFGIALSVLAALFMVMLKGLFKFCIAFLEFLINPNYPLCNRLFIIILPLLIAGYYYVETSNNIPLLIIFLAACFVLALYCFYQAYKYRSNVDSSPAKPAPKISNWHLYQRIKTWYSRLDIGTMFERVTRIYFNLLTTLVIGSFSGFISTVFITLFSSWVLTFIGFNVTYEELISSTFAEIVLAISIILFSIIGWFIGDGLQNWLNRIFS